MTERNDGGPAFPMEYTEHSSIDAEGRPMRVSLPGMSLRDWFAGQLAAAELAAAGANIAAAVELKAAAIKAGQTIEHRIAYNAYLIADALLEERRK
jgi:hypothetical protein